MAKALLISIFIVICLYFIIHMIDKKTLNRNEQLSDLNKAYARKAELLLKIIYEIQRELKFTQLKDCPKEELRQIPKEIIEWIDELFNGEEQCQKENEE